MGGKWPRGDLWFDGAGWQKDGLSGWGYQEEWWQPEMWQERAQWLQLNEGNPCMEWLIILVGYSCGKG